MVHRLIAIDLKTTRFHHEFKSQMELYLSWLDKNEREEGELPPLGLILCTEGSEEQIKYLEMDKSGIRVAHYYTELPKPEELQLIIAGGYWSQRNHHPLTGFSAPDGP